MARTALGFTTLETRSLMAAGLANVTLNPIQPPTVSPEIQALLRTTASVEVVAGELVIEGSGFDDRVTVSLFQNKIRVDTNAFTTNGTPRPGASRLFDLAAVGGVRFHGYQGNDFFENTAALTVAAFGGSGNDALRSMNSSADLFGGGVLLGESGDDTLAGGTFRIVADGGTGNDYLEGHESQVELRGGAGRDVLKDLHGGADLNGDDGDDTLFTHISGGFVDGGNGNDVLYGTAAADVLHGGAGNDTLYGYGGDDILVGEDGNDLMYAGAGNDSLDGGGGDDVLYGEDGNDVIAGNFGCDTLHGGAGDDELYGDWPVFAAGENGQDDDVIWAGTGNDHVEGGGGRDWWGPLYIG